jgi:hypothetical protein
MRSIQPLGRSGPAFALGRSSCAKGVARPRHRLAHLDASGSLDVHAVTYARRQLKTDHR